MMNGISSFILNNDMSNMACASNPPLGYYDVQLYLPTVSLIIEHQQDYGPFLPTMLNNGSLVSQQHIVVPSLLDMYQQYHASMPTSPESAASSEASPTTLLQRLELETCFLVPEFHQYSKENYENSSSSGTKRKRRNHDMDTPTELRRQVHIQSEKKRRAEIKDGFDALRQQLPGCANKRMSKTTLLHRAVQHMQHMNKNQVSILIEIERLIQENETLRNK